MFDGHVESSTEADSRGRMNRWYFWVLAPVMLATLGLAKPRRFQWALRAVAGAILLGYLAYATHEAFAWWQGKPLGLLAPRAASNLVNALWGLAVFGLPSLYFLFRGRSGASVDVLLDIRNGSDNLSSEGRAVEQRDEAAEH